MATTLNPTPRTPESLLTEVEVAALFRVTRRTVQRWAAAGTLNAVRVHGITRYRAQDVAALIDPSTSEATAANGGPTKLAGAGDGHSGP